MNSIDPDAYDAISGKYADHVESAPIHTHYTRPATLAVLGARLDGVRVLDAGCGTGWYANELAARGAQVTAIDGSATMLDEARKRATHAIDFRQADLGTPLPFPDAVFDLVLSVLAIHYVRDYERMFAEFARVLRPGGRLVVVTHHVVMETRMQKPADYFVTELFEDEWRGIGKIIYWRRPLAAVFQPLLDAGFNLTQIVEPRPLPSLRAINEEAYEFLAKQPHFILLEAVKR